MAYVRITRSEIWAVCDWDPAKEYLVIWNRDDGPRITRLPKSELTCGQLFLHALGCGKLVHYDLSIRNVAARISESACKISLGYDHYKDRDYELYEFPSEIPGCTDNASLFKKIARIYHEASGGRRIIAVKAAEPFQDRSGNCVDSSAIREQDR